MPSSPTLLIGSALLVVAGLVFKPVGAETKSDESKPSTTSIASERETYDEIIRRGKKRVQHLAKLELKMSEEERGAFESLDKAIAAIEIDDVVGDLDTLAALRPIVQSLLPRGRQVIDAYASLQNTTEDYRDELDKAIPLFEQIQNEMRKFEKEESYEELKGYYRLQASIFGKEAERFRERAKTLGPAMKAVDESIEFTGRSVLLLERMDESLELLDPLVVQGSDVETFLQNLKSYAKRFQRLRASMELFHGKLESLETGETARNSRPSTSPQPARAVTRVTRAPRVVMKQVVSRDHGRKLTPTLWAGE